MSQYRNQADQVAYPSVPTPVSYPATNEQFKELSSGIGKPYVAAPPPVGYPVRDNASDQYPQLNYPHETNSKGDGFWKGCCAALCCCWVLDCVF